MENNLIIRKIEVSLHEFIIQGYIAKNYSLHSSFIITKLIANRLMSEEECPGQAFDYDISTVEEIACWTRSYYQTNRLPKKYWNLDLESLRLMLALDGYYVYDDGYSVKTD